MRLPARGREGVRLIGRDADLAALRAKRSLGARLLTLFGPAGIGKTALARELDPDSIRVDLSEASDRSDVCRAIGRALGGGDASSLVAAIQARDAPVFLLDSCERAIDALAALLHGWLAEGVSATFVVTSRELLRVPAEYAFEVGPLAVPGPDARTSDAVLLFLARAAQVRQEELQEGELPVVADIVRWLEGIPLALILAASRLSILSPSELRARLETDFGTLASEGRGAHPRQRSMQASIAWSWARLSPAERALLRRLAALEGSFDVQAAEAAANLEEAGSSRVLDLLQSLRSKSFLRGEECAGRVRLRIYRVIREFVRRARDEEGDAGARQTSPVEASEGPRVDAARSIEIGPNGSWFCVDRQSRVDLHRRRATRLVLRALTEQRLRAPGVPVPMKRLIEIGWPGEKMLLHAGMSRLYVTVRSLRDLGLRAALLCQDNGYLLDPSVPILQNEGRRASSRPPVHR